jgi:excisionase family DNA binding protein
VRLWEEIVTQEAPDKLFSVDAAAAYLGGISKWTVRSWLAKGKLRPAKVGARTMIRESDLRAFISACNPERPARSKSSRSNGGEQ